MDLPGAKEVVKKAICDVLENEVQIDDHAKLIGGDSLLDSMKLVELCLSLEDRAEEAGFEFDWTSEVAMSKSKSLFRDVVSLSQAFSEQSGG